MLGDRAKVEAVIEDYITAPVSDAEKALFAFVEIVNARRAEIGRADIGTLKDAGWDDESILDAINVCGLFNCYNRLVNGCGAHPLSDSGHAASGRRIARDGYRVP